VIDVDPERRHGRDGSAFRRRTLDRSGESPAPNAPDPPAASTSPDTRVVPAPSPPRPGVPAALRLDASSGGCDPAPSASRSARSRRVVRVWKTAVQGRMAEFGEYVIPPRKKDARNAYQQLLRLVACESEERRGRQSAPSLNRCVSLLNAGGNV
jgi:hypothetical protein